MEDDWRRGEGQDPNRVVLLVKKKMLVLHHYAANIIITPINATSSGCGP
jgi:hypothetical protein